MYGGTNGSTTEEESEEKAISDVDDGVGTFLKSVNVEQVPISLDKTRKRVIRRKTVEYEDLGTSPELNYEPGSDNAEDGEVPQEEILSDIEEKELEIKVDSELEEDGDMMYQYNEMEYAFPKGEIVGNNEEGFDVHAEASSPTLEVFRLLNEGHIREYQNAWQLILEQKMPRETEYEWRGKRVIETEVQSRKILMAVMVNLRKKVSKKYNSVFKFKDEAVDDTYKCNFLERGVVPLDLLKLIARRVVEMKINLKMGYLKRLHEVNDFGSCSRHRECGSKPCLYSYKHSEARETGLSYVNRKEKFYIRRIDYDRVTRAGEYVVMEEVNEVGIMKTKYWSRGKSMQTKTGRKITESELYLRLLWQMLSDGGNSYQKGYEMTYKLGHYCDRINYWIDGAEHLSAEDVSQEYQYTPEYRIEREAMRHMEENGRLEKDKVESVSEVSASTVIKRGSIKRLLKESTNNAEATKELYNSNIRQKTQMGEEKSMNERIEQYHYARPFLPREKKMKRQGGAVDYPVDKVLGLAYDNQVKIKLPQFRKEGQESESTRTIGIKRIKERDQGSGFKENLRKFELERHAPKLVNVPRDENIGVKGTKGVRESRSVKVIEDGVLKIVKREGRNLEEIPDGIDVNKWLGEGKEVKLKTAGLRERGKEEKGKEYDEAKGGVKREKAGKGVKQEVGGDWPEGWAGSFELRESVGLKEERERKGEDEESGSGGEKREGRDKKGRSDDCSDGERRDKRKRKGKRARRMGEGGGGGPGSSSSSEEGGKCCDGYCSKIKRTIGKNEGTKNRLKYWRLPTCKVGEKGFMAFCKRWPRRIRALQWHVVSRRQRNRKVPEARKIYCIVQRRH